MQYMKETHHFSPSKRAFQTQFRRWDFPSKQNPAHRNSDLVSRVKELWEQNYTQRDMVRTLNEEGFAIKERELMRVRAKNRWLLRIPNGQKPTAEEENLQAELLAAAAAIPDDRTPADAASLSTPMPAPVQSGADELPEEVIRKRKERHDQMQAESDERWAAKKRRRRTRDYGGIPADPPGPPRFPSETTLGESMELLSMDGKLYRDVRAQFQAICEEMRIIKKTLAGTDKWAEVKNRLIQENAHLTAVFADPLNTPAKELALDVIATDVTKRMRTIDTRMTIVDAKNTLGVNPEQSRQIRNSFYLILQNDHFTSKLETGPEHWEELKEQWVNSSPLLTDLMREDQEPEQLVRKKKALEVLCRDVMKRLRDAQKKGGSASSPKPAAAKTTMPTTSDPKDVVTAPVVPPLPSAGQFDLGDLQIDPSLLQPTEEAVEAPMAKPIAAYIKPHPHSQAHARDKMFIVTLTTRHYSELETAIKVKWSDSVITSVEGLSKAPDGSEITFPVDGDDELDAYLDHVQGSKVKFLVQASRL